MAQPRKETVRTTIRLQPGHKVVLDQMAEWSGVPLSELLRGMIEPAMPALTTLVQTISAANGHMPPKTLAALSGVLDAVSEGDALFSTIEGRATEALVSLDGGKGGRRKSSSESGGAARPEQCEDGSAVNRRKSRSKGSLPPSSNTGVTFSPKGGS